MHHERRRLDLRDVAERRALPQFVHQVGLVRPHAEFHFLVLVVIGHVVVAHQVDDGAAGNGGLEDVRLCDQPRRELTAITAALDAQTRAIDPRIASNGGVHAVEHVLRFITVLIAEHRVGERLSITGRPAVVHHQRGPSARGVDLALHVEGGALLAMRAAVDHHDQRVLRRVRLAGWPRQKRFDVEPVVVAHERERLDLGERLARQHCTIEIGQRLAVGAGHHVELRHVTRGRKRVGDAVGGSDVELAHGSTIRHHGLAGTALGRQTIEPREPALLDREEQRSPVGGPRRRPLAIVDARSRLATIVAVRVHHPHVRVFHCRLEIGDAAPGSLVGDASAIRRPHRPVLRVLRCRETTHDARAGANGEDVVVEELIGVRLTIGDEQDLVAGG